jgi:hypothetical protein
VGLLYPNLRYYHRPKRVQFEGGFSFGSLHKWNLGFSRVLSDAHSLGFNAEWDRHRLVKTLSHKAKSAKYGNFTTSMLLPTKRGLPSS